MRYALLVAWMTMGCAVDHASTAPLVDPTGIWDVALTWTTGSCGLTGEFSATITVERSATGYAVNEPGAHGTVLCSRDFCQLLFTEAGPGPAGTSVTGVSMSADLTVDDDAAIAGSGMVAYQFRNSSTCSQQFSAVGLLR